MSNIKKKLEVIVKPYEEKMKIIKDIEKKEIAKSIKEFNKVKKKMIIPVMNKFCDELTKNGHHCYISEGKYELKMPPYVFFAFLPSQFPANDILTHAPNIVYSYDFNAKEISVRTSTSLRGLGDARTSAFTGNYKINEISKEKITQDIMKIIDIVFSREDLFKN